MRTQGKIKEMTSDNLGTEFNGKKKARKTPEQKIAELQKKQEQLQARIKDEQSKLKSQARKQDTRRKIVAGAIALEHMEHDENFKVAMQDIIRKHVKDTDKALFDF